MNKSTLNLVLTAMFVALILLLGFTPLGLIPLGFVNVTILCIPVIIGTICLGLKTGLVLGVCFGTVSALSAFGIAGTPSSLAATLVAANPFLALVMCFVPRLLVPVVTYFAHAGVSRISGSARRLALPVSAAAGSLCNTVFYLGLMLLFYMMMGIEYANLLALIGGTGLIAGSCEAAAAAILTTPIVVALRKIH